ncbi:MAG: sugar phosphate isomerase/epimerase [Armatimonadetes bacterium]|nr:sugar phosphate isomerase/epimerase [Armatimonadota bacterium]
MKLGMTMYSFNTYAREGKMTVLDFIRFAADAGLECVDLLAYYWKNETEEPDEARELLNDLGIELAAYAVGNNFCQESEIRRREQIDIVRRGIEMAHRLEAPVLRVFGGHAPHMDKRDALQIAADSLGEVVSEAEEAGVVLAVENHGGVPGTSEEVIWLLSELDTPWVRACVDVGNFVPVGEDPAEAVARVVGYAAHAHIKDFRRVLDEQGRESWKPCTPGSGDLDYPTILRVFANAGYAGALAIEAEGPEDDMEAATAAIEWLRGLLEQIRGESE